MGQGKYNADTIWTIAVRPEYRDVCILKVSVNFWRVLQCILVLSSTTKLCPRALPCGTLVRRANRRLVLCAPDKVQSLNQSAVVADILA